MITFLLAYNAIVSTIILYLLTKLWLEDDNDLSLEWYNARMATLQGKKKGGGKQLSKTALRELIRPHVPDLIAKALYIAEYGDSDSNKIGAIKLLLGKVIPDIKAQEITGKDGEQLTGLILIQADSGEPIKVAK